MKFILFIKKFFENVKNNHQSKSNKPTIPFLVFWIGTKCTLKCKLCCNLIPYIKQQSSNSNEILKDLKFICKNSYIKNLQIQGGEPFTHPNIDKIIDNIGKIKNISQIELATNGTLNLSKKVIFALKRNPNIKVRISNYDCTKNLRKNFIEQLEKAGINYAKYEFIYGNNTWFSTGGIYEQKENDNEKVTETYKKCEEKGCVTYYNGKIYTCGKIPAIRYLYKVEGNVNFDTIDVRSLRKSHNNKKMQTEINNFYRNYGLFREECRYCKISDEKYPAAQQLHVEELKSCIRENKQK